MYNNRPMTKEEKEERAEKSQTEAGQVIALSFLNTLNRTIHSLEPELISDKDTSNNQNNGIGLNL